MSDKIPEQQNFDSVMTYNRKVILLEALRK